MAWAKGDLLTQNNNLYLITEVGKGTNYFIGMPEYEDPDNWYDWLTIKDLSNGEEYCKSQPFLEGEGYCLAA